VRRRADVDLLLRPQILRVVQQRLTGLAPDGGWLHLGLGGIDDAAVDFLFGCVRALLEKKPGGDTCGE
jgi:hypothetical protein